MDGVKVGFPLPPPFNSDQAGAFQFPHKFGHAGAAHAHVLRQPILARKTGIIVPGIAQKHGVGDLGTNGEVGVFEDEIGDLGKTTTQHGIVRVQFEVLLLDHFPDGFHL